MEYIHPNGVVDKTRTTSSCRGAYPAGFKAQCVQSPVERETPASRQWESRSQNLFLWPVSAMHVVPVLVFKDIEPTSMFYCIAPAPAVTAAPTLVDECSHVLTSTVSLRIWWRCCCSPECRRTGREFAYFRTRTGIGRRSFIVNDRPAHVVVCVEPVPAGKHIAMSQQR